MKKVRGVPKKKLGHPVVSWSVVCVEPDSNKVFLFYAPHLKVQSSKDH